MIAVDTNILVRYITNDDENQAILAAKLLDKYSIMQINMGAFARI